MKLIVIDGIDGSGKTTQCELLKNKFKVIKFPTQESDLVRKYLNGELGKNLNPYVVASIFAIDRYLTMSKLVNEEIIICDRYASSNLMYLSKEMGKWLEEYEYEIVKNPKPDKVIFLDMPPKYAKKLREKRGEKKDIHEEYLLDVYKRALYTALINHWKIISCVEDDKIKTIEQIQQEISALI
jgi:dTMP kinase